MQQLGADPDSWKALDDNVRGPGRRLAMLHAIVTKLYDLTDPGEMSEFLTAQVRTRWEYRDCRVTLLPHAESDRPAPIYAQRRFPASRLDEDSALHVPLAVGGRVLGDLVVSGSSVGRFTSEDLQLMQVLASQAAVALDNARLRRAEHEATTKYRILIEQTPAVVYVAAFGESGDWLYMSPQLESVLGYTPEEWLAHPAPFHACLHPDDRESVLAEEVAWATTGGVLRQEYRMIARDGRTVWIRDEAMLVKDQSDQPLFWQGVMYDITDQKRAQVEAAHALEAEREAIKRLRAVDEMKNAFLQAVSHDLRTPLTVIMGVALTLEREDLSLSSADARELLRRLAANARKLNRLLADLLDLDRLTRGIIAPNRHPTDLGALVRGVVEEAEFLTEHPIEIDVEEVVAEVDASKVERIVENLLANAAKHTPAGTRVWLRVIGEDGGVRITVEDEGDGVPEELRRAIFAPFKQGPSPSHHSPGVGIGLALVQRFAELHGGWALVEPRQAGGASFQVFLPTTPPAELSLPAASEPTA